MQALIDVVGDDDTYRAIYHVGFGVSEIFSTMEALNMTDLAMVPHVVCGLYYGRIKGEPSILEDEVCGGLYGPEAETWAFAVRSFVSML